MCTFIFLRYGFDVAFFSSTNFLKKVYMHHQNYNITFMLYGTQLPNESFLIFMFHFLLLGKISRRASFCM